MIEYKTLDKVPLGVLHKCFTEAFAAYSVSSKFTPEVMMRTNTMRGVNYHHSVGAFDGKDMVAFALNSVGMLDRKKTAYDSGTGVIKSYRNKGIAKEMFLHVKELLKQNGFQNYLLEVASNNDAAKNLYSRLGFMETRRFISMRLAGKPLSVVKQNLEVENAPKEMWPELRRVMEADSAMKPSWQNSWDSVAHMPEVFKVSIVRSLGDIGGVALFSPYNGNILQFWVNSQWRGGGIGSALIANVAENSKSRGILAFMNIESGESGIINFFRGRGFENWMSKSEFQLELFPRVVKK